jgi:general secretion pathway protein M
MKWMVELRAWYLSLERRDQRMLAVGMVCLLAIFFYTALLNPYLSSERALAADVEKQQALLTWMHPAASQIQALRGQQPAALPAGQSLLAVLNQSAGAAGFGNTLKQVQTNSDGSVNVQMQAAGFDTLIRWLGSVQQQYGVSIREFNMQRSAAPGTVDATLTLQASRQ